MEVPSYISDFEYIGKISQSAEIRYILLVLFSRWSARYLNTNGQLRYDICFFHIFCFCRIVIIPRSEFYTKNFCTVCCIYCILYIVYFLAFAICVFCTKMDIIICVVCSVDNVSPVQRSKFSSSMKICSYIQRHLTIFSLTKLDFQKLVCASKKRNGTLKFGNPGY